jgi:hypothetical protein
MDGQDRRNNSRPAATGAVYMDCRLCWRPIRLDFDRVEIVQWEVVYRCPHCESTFLIRRDDANAITPPERRTTKR